MYCGNPRVKRLVNQRFNTHNVCCNEIHALVKVGKGIFGHNVQKFGTHNLSKYVSQHGQLPKQKLQWEVESEKAQKPFRLHLAPKETSFQCQKILAVFGVGNRW